MKDTSNHITNHFLTEIYVVYRPLVFRYLSYKLNDCQEAEDLAQDAFLRLLEYQSMLRPETVRSFLYTIVRNLVTDYLRRHYKKQEVMACMYEGLATSVEDMESAVIAEDLSCQEKKQVNKLSPKMRTVYSMSRFEEKTAAEISEKLCLSKRTVEGYLLTGRKIVREYIRKCI